LDKPDETARNCDIFVPVIFIPAKPVPMKKYIPLLLFVFVLSASRSVAQDTPIRLGLKVSPLLSWMSPGTKYYNYNGLTGGLSAGLISDFYFAENYAFSTGFNFSFLNGKMKYDDILIENGDSINGVVDRKYNFLYLDIPYMVKMSTRPFGKFSIFGQIGFSTGFRISAKARDTFYPEGGTETENQSNISSSTTLIRQAVVVGLGTEFHIDEQTRIFLGATYSNSLNNILTGTNIRFGISEKALLNYAELNLGVLF
jgi:hypothetical protein